MFPEINNEVGDLRREAIVPINKDFKDKASVFICCSYCRHPQWDDITNTPLFGFQRTEALLFQDRSPPLLVASFQTIGDLVADVWGFLNAS